ncbi:MAG: reverse gyrase [Candidatus Bathyarchaeia archaeon]|nr:reverse gyrase [Candidatus Bathyarchaeota archaeon]
MKSTVMAETVIEGLMAIYRGMCPNCGGDISDTELLSTGVCRKCLPEQVADKEKVYLELVKRGRIGEYTNILEVEFELKRFSEFFSLLIGSRPWALQEVWAKRVLMGRSFSIVAPTGIGKTHFGLIMALYLARKGKKSYIMVPTSLLVKHLLDRASFFLEKLAARGEPKPTVIGYYSGMRKKEMEETLERIRNKDFSILITTDRFLYNRFELIKDVNFDFIFVDDVDSFLKSPKNIDKVVLLMGFSIDDIERALKEEEKKEPIKAVPVASVRFNPGRVLVVSGATLRGKRTKRIKIFRRLFGFEPGFSPEFVRNISNLYIKSKGNVTAETVEIIRRHGSGCLIFVPQVKGLEYAREIALALKEAGISAFVYERMSPRMLEKFVNGEYAALVGVASNRSPLARGLDLPETIRYVVFAGVPRREIKVSVNECSPQKILTLLRALAPFFEEKFSREAAPVIAALSKIVPVTKNIIDKIREADEKNIELDGFAGHVQRIVKEARKLLVRIMEDIDLRKVTERLDVDVKIEGNEYILVIPDVDGYIQASGRSSRFYAMGISRGVSILIVEDEKAFYGLSKRIQLVTEEEFEEYSLEKAQEEFRQVDRDREIIKRIRRGEFTIDAVDIIRSALIVVESPTKARTIAFFFGRPAKRNIGDFTVYEVASGQMILNVVASGGHVFDLTTEGGFHGVLKENGLYIPAYTDIRKCNNCGEQFTDRDECPSCGSKDIRSKRSVIELIQKLATEVNKVFIATDPDAEGEKIGYDIYVMVKPYCRNVERLEFHEVTRRALRKALTEPRSIRLPYVQAQVVRRIEDRWVGFELSRKLWERFKMQSLSAGRVQTPVLGWVIKRVEELKNKIPVAEILLENGLSVRIVNPPNVEELKRKFKDGELIARIEGISFREDKVYPQPPYTTDSMLKDAAQKLGFTVGYTMGLAQTLFESGLITYHRTDATTVSTTGIDIARRYIEENHPGLFKPREYRGEGAHECIRPTKPLNLKQLRFYLSSGVLRIPQKLGADHLKLYDMIFRRFIASQMSDAKILVQEFTLEIDGVEVRQSRVVKVLEQGFLAVNPIIRIDEEVHEGEYKVVKLRVKKEPTVRPYREGDLIALMKERGIGRPSTYSKIIDILLKRRYVIENKRALFSTRLGRTVYNYLVEKFSSLVSEDLTRNLERTIDAIENGQARYQDVLRAIENEIRSIIG